MKSMIQALARPKLRPDAGVPAPGERRGNPKEPKPASASAPARRNSRRDMRSARRKLGQPKVIARSPWKRLGWNLSPRVRQVLADARRQIPAQSLPRRACYDFGLPQL